MASLTHTYEWIIYINVCAGCCCVFINAHMCNSMKVCLCVCECVPVCVLVLINTTKCDENYHWAIAVCAFKTILQYNKRSLTTKLQHWNNWQHEEKNELLDYWNVWVYQNFFFPQFLNIYVCMWINARSRVCVSVFIQRRQSILTGECIIGFSFLFL